MQLKGSAFAYIKEKNSDDIFKKTREMIKEDAAYYVKCKMDKKISIFANNLINADLCAEKTCTDLYAVPLLDNLIIIGKQRGAYAFLIDSMKGRLNLDCQTVTDQLRESMLWWERLRVSLTKSIIRKSSSCDKVFVDEAISRIREIETEVIMEFLKI